MFNKPHTSKLTYTTIFLIIICCLIFLIPLLLESVESDIFSNNYSLEDDNLLPYSSKFEEDNYTPIISKEEHGLGEITITNLIFNEIEIGFYLFNDSYPLLLDDYEKEHINMTIKSIRYIETLENAKVNILKGNSINNRKITVKINETLEVEYNNSKEGYLIYHSRYNPCRLVDVQVRNRSQTTTLINETHYIVDESNFLVFNYNNYFKDEGSRFNFSMHLMWEYDIAIPDWKIEQINEDNLVMEGNEDNLTAKFNYQFKVRGRKFSDELELNEGNVEGVSYIEVALRVNVVDKELLEFESLKLNDEIVEIDEYIKSGKIISISLLDFFHTNLSLFSLNFTTSYLLKFQESVGKTWAIDRLVEMRNVRERLYIISLISGPEQIFLQYVYFYEPTFNFDKVLDTFAFFEREIEVSFVNYSLTGKRGTKVLLPYLIKGESCPFMITYTTNVNLRIIITDVIRMPLVGAKIDIFYHNKSYGTYISNDHVQPIGVGRSDGNGEISIPNVPRGNYTVKVYYEGNFLKEANVNTFEDRNFIHTTAPHFPLWLIIFGATNASVLLIGIIIYLKYKKVRQ